MNWLPMKRIIKSQGASEEEVEGVLIWVGVA